MTNVNEKLDQLLNDKNISLDTLSKKTGINIIVLFFSLKLRILKPRMIRTLQICKALDINMTDILTDNLTDI